MSVGGTRINDERCHQACREAAGRKANVRYIERQLGDVSHTGADVSRARTDFGFQPKVTLQEGLALELEFVEKVVLPLGV